MKIKVNILCFFVVRVIKSLWKAIGSEQSREESIKNEEIKRREKF